MTEVTNRLSREQEQFSVINNRLVELEQLSKVLKNQTKINYEYQQEKLSVQNEKIREMASEMQHIDHKFDIRDEKIEQTGQMLTMHKS